MIEKVVAAPFRAIGNLLGIEHEGLDEIFFAAGSAEIPPSESEKLVIVKRDKERFKLENRYYALGRTNMNRLLFAVFTVRNDKIRIISARDMTDSGMERYIK